MNKKVYLYLIVTFAFSWSMWGLQYLGQEGILPEFVQIFGMFGLFGPLIGFLVVVKHQKKGLKVTFRQLFEKSPKSMILFAIISPMILSGVAYLFYSSFESNPEKLGVTFVTFIPIAIIILFVGGPIEEFGWRGFLLPELRSKYSIVVTVVILGLIHGVWHIPLHFLNGTVQEALPIYEFIVVTVAITVSYVFIYEFTKSIIPMIVLHWFANYSSAIFPYYYSVEGRYSFLIITLVFDVVLLYILRIRSRKEVIVK